MMTYAPVVLAAGKDTRMLSTLQKLLHPLAGLPLIAHVPNALDSIPAAASYAPLLSTLAAHCPTAVIGNETDQIERVFGERCYYAL
jgi:bifunctional UDP-N-acetylglucosamine pyrophosphorylase/glucosamine-1-phosphate N-acetyltransferase